MPPLSLRPPIEEIEGILGFLATEGIPRDTRLLDVPCGIGRRALGLAEAGFTVTAVDPNEMGIAAAKARIPHGLEGRLTFVAARRETLPGLPTEDRFDLILSLDHPLGRTPSEDEVAFLGRLKGHVREGGRLVLDLLHRDFFSARRRAFAFHAIGPVEQHEFRSFDPVTGVLRLEWTFYERVGEDLKHRTESVAEMTLPTPQDVRAVLDRAGWHLVNVWGGWGREPVNSDRRKLIVLATPTG